MRKYLFNEMFHHFSPLPGNQFDEAFQHFQHYFIHIFGNFFIKHMMHQFLKMLHNLANLQGCGSMMRIEK